MTVGRITDFFIAMDMVTAVVVRPRKWLIVALLAIVSMPMGAAERFLVPVASDGVVGATGSVWFSYVTLFNYGAVDVVLGEDVGPFGHCDAGPTPRVLPPRNWINTCSFGLPEGHPPALIMEVQNETPVALSSRVISPSREVNAIPVPVVPVADFEELQIFGSIPVHRDERLALRLYHDEPHAVTVRISVYQEGYLKLEHTTVLNGSPYQPGYGFFSLNELFSLDAPSVVSLVIAFDRPGWGMITSTTTRDQVTVYTPGATGKVSR